MQLRVNSVSFGYEFVFANFSSNTKGLWGSFNSGREDRNQVNPCLFERLAEGCAAIQEDSSCLSNLFDNGVRGTLFIFVHGGRRGGKHQQP